VSLWLYFGELLEKRLEPTRSTAEAEALRKKTEHGAFLRDSLAAALPKLGTRWQEKAAPLCQAAEAIKTEFIEVYGRQ
jgi:hypothetical protein